ncbi:MAG: response regulator [Eubacteriales bacterium]|jgi:two-component system response regulator VicR|nr:response regulator transcription factor [Clostridiales bacterium]
MQGQTEQKLKDKKKKILIVEDERNIAQLLAYNMMQAGYDYDIAADGVEGLRLALTGEYDLILLDLMLPKMDGFEVCRRAREKINTPIIIVTAREEEVEKVMGLEIGADDYVTKPFKLKELMARIKANIRRASNEFVQKPDPEENIIKLRGLVIDLSRYHVTNNGVEVSLTKKDYDLLVHMAKHPGRVFTREELLEQVWGYEGYYGDIRTVDVAIRRLREKLEVDPTKPEYLFTKRGVGYYVN